MKEFNVKIPKLTIETHPKTGAIFTGATTRTGEKIYEGDVVKLKPTDYVTYVVYWNSTYLHWGLFSIKNTKNPDQTGLRHYGPDYTYLTPFDSIEDAQAYYHHAQDTHFLTNSPTQKKKENIQIIGSVYDEN